VGAKGRPGKLVGVACAVAIVGSAVVIVRELRGACTDDVSDYGVDDGVAAGVVARSLRLADGLSCEVYVPAHDDPTRLHPLVLAFSPNGRGADAVAVWHRAADANGWIVVGSNNFRNGPYVEHDAALRMETITVVEREYRVDPARVYAAGISGGAMQAYDIVGDHPGVFRGVIANTGVMPYHLLGNAAFDATTYPRGKVAVMLASPTDFRYRDMQLDRALLEAAGWKVEWIEFEGGHRYAPPAVYERAAAWLTSL
jgi:predicted esterase